MSTMKHLQSAFKSSPFSLRTTHSSNSNQTLPCLLRRFSTDAEEPSQQHDSPAEPLIPSPGKGTIYGKLFGITRNTMKTDIVNFFEGCDLSPDNVRVEYSRGYAPLGMVIQFRSRYEFDQAFRLISKKGRLYRMEKADRSQWDLLNSHDGKTLLLQGLPQNALLEDVERLLSGCEYDASSINMFNRGFPDPVRMATISFPSRTQAMHAFITKNGGYCLNNQISVRILQ